MGRGSSEAVASKLRRAMCAPERNPLSGLVEVDETSIRQRTGQGAKGSRGHSHDGKLLIAGAEPVTPPSDRSSPSPPANRPSHTRC